MSAKRPDLLNRTVYFVMIAVDFSLFLPQGVPLWQRVPLAIGAMWAALDTYEAWMRFVRWGIEKGRR